MNNQPDNIEAGFSVLEAMISVAIMAAALLPLMSLQSQFVTTSLAYERMSERIDIRQDVLNRLEGMNFSRFPTGEESLGAYQLTWFAERVQNSSQNSVGAQNDSFGRYDLRLYSVTVEISHKGVITESFSLNGMGWAPNQRFLNALF